MIHEKASWHGITLVTMQEGLALLLPAWGTCYSHPLGREWVVVHGPVRGGQGLGTPVAWSTQKRAPWVEKGVEVIHQGEELRAFHVVLRGEGW